MRELGVELPSHRGALLVVGVELLYQLLFIGVGDVLTLAGDRGESSESEEVIKSGEESGEEMTG